MALKQLQRDQQRAPPGHERARGKISTLGAFLGAFFLIILGKARLGSPYWVLFEPQTTHHFLEAKRLVRRRPSHLDQDMGGHFEGCGGCLRTQVKHYFLGFFSSHINRLTFLTQLVKCVNRL